MKVLFFGDIVGKIGRRAVIQTLPSLREKYQPDVVLANVENLAHGKGVTAKTLKEIKEAGFDCLTSGNHVWKKEEVHQAAEESGVCLITPANDPRTIIGHGYKILNIGQDRLLVINLLGRVFIEEKDLRCPFKEADKILAAAVSEGLQAIIVDFHAEATSEKVALGWYLDGRISALLGTHTHIPTSDCKILPKGCGYVTDIGMVGPVDSVLGVKKELIIEKFLTDGPIVFKMPEEGEVEINAVYLEIDDQTKQTTKIEKIYQKILIT